MAVHMSGYLVSCSMWHWNIRWPGTTLLSSDPEGMSEGIMSMDTHSNLDIDFSADWDTSSTLLNIKLIMIYQYIYDSTASYKVNILAMWLCPLE